MFMYFETLMPQYLDGRHVDFILEIEATRSRPVHQETPNGKLSGSRSLLIVLGSAFADLRHWLGSWLKYRQTCDKLMRLSERELQDVGICRTDIFGARAQLGRCIPPEPATLRLDRIPIIH